MKTSNIILLAVFASILIWVFAAFMIAKSKIVKLTGDSTSTVHEQKNDIKKETIKLDAFHTISVTGNGNLFIEQSEGYFLEQFIGENNITEVKNDTLFIQVSGEKGILNVKEINNIITTENAMVEIYDIKTDTFNILAKENSRLEINGLKCPGLIIKAFDNSNIELNDVNKKDMKAEFFLKNSSKLSIDDTEGMSLSVQKDSGAKYYDN